jgi:hypothetical protein
VEAESCAESEGHGQMFYLALEYLSGQDEAPKNIVKVLSGVCEL